jgi:hypothetical protein
VLFVGSVDADELVELAIPGSPTMWWIGRVAGVVAILAGLFAVFKRLRGKRVPGRGSLTHGARPAATMTIPLALAALGGGASVVRPILGAIAFVLAGGTFVAALMSERAFLRKQLPKAEAAAPTPPARGS